MAINPTLNLTKPEPHSHKAIRLLAYLPIGQTVIKRLTLYISPLTAELTKKSIVELTSLLNIKPSMPSLNLKPLKLKPKPKPKPYSVFKLRTPCSAEAHIKCMSGKISLQSELRPTFTSQSIKNRLNAKCRQCPEFRYKQLQIQLKHKPKVYGLKS